MTSGGNNFNNFPENQLTKFRVFRDSGRDSVAIDDKRVPRLERYKIVEICSLVKML